MRGDELLDQMELTDPAYVEAADIKPEKKKNVWIKGSAIAACFAIMIYAGTRLLPPDAQREIPGSSGALEDISGVPDAPGGIAGLPDASEEIPDIQGILGDISGVQDAPEEVSGLPMLSISESKGGMGFEGYLAYDISELVNENPWNETLELSTLPVFQNPLTFDPDYIALGGDFDKMEEFLLEVAGRLGLDTNKLTITESTTHPKELMAEADGLKIQVDQWMTARVTFDPTVPLPEEYNFTYYASYDDKAAAAEYLKTEYRDFIGMDNPQINIHGGNYNIYGQQSYSIRFFDAGGNEIEQMINYNFNKVVFSSYEGELRRASIYHPDLSIKVGDYPIISCEQARELLAKGGYITSAPFEMPGLEYVKKVELIYRTSYFEEYYMPYYRFYVELPEEEMENGLKTYGAYYVPAVHSSYISNMPIWDGRFNS